MQLVLLLQAVGGRTLIGHEAFSAIVSAPDGAGSAVPVILAEGGGHYQATLQWLQTGIHKVRKSHEPRSFLGGSLPSEKTDQGPEIPEAIAMHNLTGLPFAESSDKILAVAWPTRMLSALHCIRLYICR